MLGHPILLVPVCWVGVLFPDNFCNFGSQVSHRHLIIPFPIEGNDWLLVDVDCAVNPEIAVEAAPSTAMVLDFGIAIIRFRNVF